MAQILDFTTAFYNKMALSSDPSEEEMIKASEAYYHSMRSLLRLQHALEGRICGEEKE